MTTISIIEFRVLLQCYGYQIEPDPQFSCCADDLPDSLPILPDHVQEARRECTVQFVERVLLPRMRHGSALSFVELVLMVTDFKQAFEAQYPGDFNANYELIPAVDQYLLEMRMRAENRKHQSKAWSETAVLVERGIEALNRISEKHWEELFSL